MRIHTLYISPDLRVFVLAFLFFGFQNLFAQDPVIKTAIENLNEQAEQNYDYSDLMDEFLALKENPVNINSKESEKLIPLFLLDELQYQNLRQYIDSNGLLQSKNELLLVDGFSISNIQNLAPFIKAEKITQQNYPKPSKVLKYGRHQVFLRYQRALQNTQGYQGRNDSVWNSNPNSKYLGNADKYYFKYKFNYSDRISAGLVAEKDAGEIFFEDINNPTLDSLIGDKIQKGFDFYAAHLYIQHFGIIKQAVVGDYHLLFGQGLNMWSSLAFGKSSNAINIQRYGRDIKPNSSTDENKFLRGAAVNLAKNKWNLIVFYSSKNQDASDLSENGSQEEHYLSSINGTGFHRTVNELLKKNAVNVQLYGARIQYRHSLFKIGLTASHTQLDKAILPKTTAYQYYQFSGKINNIVGADYEFRLLQMNIYGEFSYQLQGGWAFMSGLNAPLSSRFALALLYRNYQKDYQNLYAAAFGENSQNNNEEGLFMGFNFQVAQKIKMNAYADIFRFPWLKFRVDAPTYGSEYMTQIDYDYSREVQMYVKLRYKNKAINTSDDSTPLGRVEEQTKYSIRYHISYKLHPLFTLKNRIEYQVYKTPSQGAQPGFLIFQDIQYKSKNQKLGLTARFALFDVDDYDSRIYAYENDLLYVFSVPAYYNRGIRAYGLMSYKVSDKIQFWFKIANTWYENKEEISSGLNLIKGSHKTEIRGQLRIKI